MTHALERLENLLAAPYVALVVLRYRIMRFINQPMHATIDGLQQSQWLAELMLGGTLFVLGVLINSGVTAVAFAALMPIPLWATWLLLHGGAHIACLFWGNRHARLICTIFHPWVYGTLLYTSIKYSGAPRVAVASLSVSLIVSLMIPFTLRDRHGGE